MSDPALVAAKPVLIAALTALQTFGTTVLTGDPMQLPLRIDAAADIFVGQLKLQIPALASAEQGAVLTGFNAKVGDLLTKVNALS